ncbi:hypothetical protein [Tardiphaga sp. 839_C3_N1_4]|uniref:hypothetical protein n=1 Tax=Tardiphaga sp. 839_C3_N1_4 TaxID=3240761 RepID=UPI003F257092
MEPKNLPGLTPAWLVSLALALGTTIVVMIPVSIASGDPIKSSDWIGFAGNVVAGAMTLVAAIVAWFAVQSDIQEQKWRFDRELELKADANNIRQAEAKYAAAIVLSQTVHAAATVAHINKRMVDALSWPRSTAAENYSYSFKIAEQMKLLDAAIPQLSMTLQYFAVAEAWRDLNIGDKAGYLMITATINTVINMFQHPPPGAQRESLIENRHQTMVDLARYIRAFDKDLANVFDRDANL